VVVVLLAVVDVVVEDFDVVDVAVVVEDFDDVADVAVVVADFDDVADVAVVVADLDDVVDVAVAVADVDVVAVVAVVAVEEEAQVGNWAIPVMTTPLVIEATVSVTESPVTEVTWTVMGVLTGKVTDDPAPQKLSAVLTSACQVPLCWIETDATGYRVLRTCSLM